MITSPWNKSVKKTDLELRNLEIKTERINSRHGKNDFYVYHLIDPRNKIAFYVGKGRGRRLYMHEWYVKNRKIPNNNRHLYNKINKILNTKGYIIYKKVLTNLSHKLSCKKETTDIKRIGRYDLGLGPLCNLTNGGEGCYGRIISEKTKGLISAAQIGKIIPDEIIQKMRKAQSKRFHKKSERLKIGNGLKRFSDAHPNYRRGQCRGKKNPMYGQIHSRESKIKMSKIAKKRLSNPKNHPNYGKHLSKETILKIKSTRKTKPINQYDLHLNFIKRWNNSYEIQNELGFHRPNIKSCIKGKTKQSNGFIWKYENKSVG